MGGANSRENLEILDSEEEEYEEQSEEEDDYQEDKEGSQEKHERSSERRPKTPSSIDEVEAKLKVLGNCVISVL